MRVNEFQQNNSKDWSVIPIANLDRLEGGRYKAPPVKSVHIPKGRMQRGRARGRGYKARAVKATTAYYSICQGDRTNATQ